MRSLLAIFVAAAALTFVGCATQPADDAGITSKVKTKMAADPNASALRVDVDTVNGVVTLKGTVPTATEKATAERIAKETEGVTRVVNNITVNPVGATTADEKAGAAAGTAGEAISDATILTKIKAQYVADGIIGTNVDVTNGAVVLKGEVENAAEKAKAEDIAKKTDGVKSVKNQITIAKKK
jgi:hyperosmotically inducible periplasmic protein